MNYLAHLHLVGSDDDMRLGALLGDFMRGTDLGAFAPAVQAGVMHHRGVDRFTDAHPVFRRSRQRLDPPFRRFGGVIIDMFYDHFLARQFARYRDESLEDFAEGVYRMFAGRLDEMPERMRRVVPRLIEGDWLNSYADPERIAEALQGMSRRVRRENPLGRAPEQLEAHYAALEADFGEFFPDLEKAWGR